MSAFPSIPAHFDRPRAGEVDVLVVAGEHSGDQHAAKVVAELLKARRVYGSLRSAGRSCAPRAPSC
jgi:hypothetical protein